MGKLYKESPKSMRIHKNDIIVLILLIFGLLTFFLSLSLSNFCNIYIKWITSFLLIADSVAIFVYLFVTYDRNSYEDIWWGHRLEIILLCVVFIGGAIAVHLI